MNAHPFRIARWALFFNFGLLVLIVSLPNPEPSDAWESAEMARYFERFPQLQNREKSPAPESEHQFAARQGQDAEPEGGKQQPAKTYRTARLPGRSEN